MTKELKIIYKPLAGKFPYIIYVGENCETVAETEEEAFAKLAEIKERLLRPEKLIHSETIEIPTK